MTDSVENLEHDPSKQVVCRIQGAKHAFLIQVVPEWSPLGAERFSSLVRMKFYDGAALFRCQKDITVQFGIPKNKTLQSIVYKQMGQIKDDPKRHDLFQQSHWHSGLISFAGGGPNTRQGQIFVTVRKDIPQLGGEVWETPFARVIGLVKMMKDSSSFNGRSMTVNRIKSVDYGTEFGLRTWKEDVHYGYGGGRGSPDQTRISLNDGYSDYLPKEFPDLSYLEWCQFRSDLEMKAEQIDRFREHAVQTETVYVYIGVATLVLLACFVVLVMYLVFTGKSKRRVPRKHW